MDDGIILPAILAGSSPRLPEVSDSGDFIDLIFSFDGSAVPSNGSLW